MKKKKASKSRRKFLKDGVKFGIASLATGITANEVIASGNANNTKDSKDKVKMLTADGELVEVDKSAVKKIPKEVFISREQSKNGIPGRRFVMVVDLAKCKNARKCIDACQEGHLLPKDHEWIKVYLLQDAETTAPYWFPRPCFHCDNPLCVSVCPVGATYKRSDGIVLVDTERCIGCKFCMTGCPFSARVFHWEKPEAEDKNIEYSPETAIPPKEGTVGKCVFCADKLRKNELPRCVTACPMGVIYFGDIIEDTVSNGFETIRFSELIKKFSGYRHLEHLGTQPSVYYLPPSRRNFPLDRGFDGLEEDIKNRYKNTPYLKGKNNNE